MKRRKKKGEAEMPVFDSLRKPTAPPSRKFGTGDQPEERAHPAQRKIKHKTPPSSEE